MTSFRFSPTSCFNKQQHQQRKANGTQYTICMVCWNPIFSKNTKTMLKTFDSNTICISLTDQVWPPSVLAMKSTVCTLFPPHLHLVSAVSLTVAGEAGGCCPDTQGVLWLCLSVRWWLLIPSNRPAWARHGWGLQRSRNYTRPSIYCSDASNYSSCAFLHAKQSKWGTQWRRMRRLTERLNCRRAYIQLQDV